jgi:hypothetical protein
MYPPSGLVKKTLSFRTVFTKPDGFILYRTSAGSFKRFPCKITGTPVLFENDDNPPAGHNSAAILPFMIVGYGLELWLINVAAPLPCTYEANSTRICCQTLCGLDLPPLSH